MMQQWADYLDKLKAGAEAARITEFHRRLTTIIFINLFAPGLGA